MSGIYIKGMEMPKHCWSCCFHDEVDDCIILKENCMTVWGEQKRLSDCPLIAVPDHGRLVDADAIDYDDYWWNRHYSAKECQQAERMVEEQPTIIPADKESDNDQ